MRYAHAQLSQTSRLARWLRLRALPLWSELGWSPTEGFAEGLTLEGRRSPIPARPGSLARLARAFAEAGALGWEGPWKARLAAAVSGFDAAETVRPRDRANRLVSLIQIKAAVPSAGRAARSCLRAAETAPYHPGPAAHPGLSLPAGKDTS